MPAVTRRPNPLGDLLRARRRASKVGYKQLYAVTGMDRETLRKWETGDTYDVPLRGVLLYARAVGISLEELEAVALPSVAPAVAPGDPRAVADSGEAVAARQAQRAVRGQRKRPRHA